MTETPGRRTVLRDLLLVVLTVTTGGADATCFLHLGQAFASVITGNLVLLGLSAAKGTGAIRRVRASGMPFTSVPAPRRPVKPA